MHKLEKKLFGHNQDGVVCVKCEIVQLFAYVCQGILTILHLNLQSC